MEDRFTRWLEREGYIVRRTEPVPEFVELGRALSNLRADMLRPVERLVAWLARRLQSSPPSNNQLDGSPKPTFGGGDS
jgi:hypothetical protein